MASLALAPFVAGLHDGGVTATIIPLHDRPPASIAGLVALTAPGLTAVNHVIIDRMQSPVALIPELAGHLIAGGGKRLRPMLTLGCAALLEYGGTRHHKLAAAVEFIHTATLLHDDVVDASGLRRGKATANRLWGNPASVLVGDFLFSRSFELMVEDGSLKVLKILSHASAIIAEGEVAQLTAQRNVETTEDRYLEIITAKTAALFAAACQISAIVAERDSGVEAALEAYGRNLGIAFQLVDDAIDYVSDADTMGKDAGDDAGGDAGKDAGEDGGADGGKDAGADAGQDGGDKDGGDKDGGDGKDAGADGGSKKPEPAPASTANQDERMLDQFKGAPTFQKEEAKLRRGKRAVGMPDK